MPSSFFLPVPIGSAWPCLYYQFAAELEVLAVEIFLSPCVAALFPLLYIPFFPLPTDALGRALLSSLPHYRPPYLWLKKFSLALGAFSLSLGCLLLLIFALPSHPRRCFFEFLGLALLRIFSDGEAVVHFATPALVRLSLVLLFSFVATLAFFRIPPFPPFSSFSPVVPCAGMIVLLASYPASPSLFRPFSAF